MPPYLVLAFSHIEVVKQLLMINGVEPNPGLPKKICYEGWTWDASRFLWPSIGVGESSLSGGVKRLLKYFNLHTKKGSMAFAGANSVLRKINDALKDLHYTNHTGHFTHYM